MDQGGFPLSPRQINTVGGPRPSTEARDRVIAVLSEAFARGALEVDEFERRVTIAHRSEVPGELVALTSDLPASSSGAAPPVPTPLARTVVPAELVRPAGMIVAIMGGSQRGGQWAVPRQLNVLALMGGSQLDLREARLPAGVVEIRIMAMMGGVQILVPPHLAVEAVGTAIMGGFAHVDRASAQPDPTATLVRITGFCLMGGVHIEMRLPGESERDARRRRKREQREERRRR
jgi:hypothetical protein